MNPQENPLDQLHDIQLPGAIRSFELAPLWWVLIAIFIAVIVFLIVRWLQRKKALRLLKPARQELQTISQLTANNYAIAELSGLLKRLCLLYFPKQQVASLTGTQWIDFLNLQARQTIFDAQSVKIFGETAYKPNQQIESDVWQKLIAQSELMVTAIISNNARKKS